MPTKNAEIKVGAAVTVGLLILICGMIWGRGAGSFESRQTLHVRFDDVKGLSKGDPVIVRGVRQGGVEAIELQPGHVDVLLRVNSSLVLYSDMTIKIEDRELMGGRQISLDPGRADVPADLEQVFTGANGTGMMQMLKKAELVLARADSVFEILNTTLSEAGLMELSKKLAAIADETSAMIRENRKTVLNVTERLDAITREIEQDSLNVRAGLILSKMDRLVVSLDTTAVSTRRVIRRLESRDGTAGRLLQDLELYNHLLRSSANLDSLLMDIRKHPKKYFKVSLF